MTAMEVLLLIDQENKVLFYDRDEKCFTGRPINEKELERIEKMSEEERSKIVIGSEEYGGNIMLPRYSEINHKEIMRFYVKEYVEEQENRTKLFNVLRRKNYVELFVNKLKELDLYNDFYDACGSIYNQILCEWMESHDIDLR